MSSADEVVAAKFSPEHIRTTVKRHGTAEYACDLDATMATIGPDPYWEYHPMGLAFVDREAVRAHYEILFATVWPFAAETERSRSYGDDNVCVEKSVRFDLASHPDGLELDSYFTAVVVVDDRHVIGERVYNAGPLATVLDQLFDESFRALPGVIDLSSRR